MARESVDTEEKEKKAPRKRVSRTTPKVAVLTETESTTPRRKAPTTVAQSSGKSYKGIYIPAIILLLGLGAAIAIGFSDKGQISVVGVVNERNARVSSGETIEGESSATSNTIVPVQNVGQGLVDGGLQGTGSPDPVPPPVVEPTATSTATSTEAQATSTEEISTTPETEVESEGSEVEGEVTTE